MERKTAYSTLAEWFEYLNDDCDYEKWSQYLVKTLAGFPSLTNGIDIGCGGGYFTRALYKAGYEMTGLDISAEMLDKAQRSAFKAGTRGEYILGDVAKDKIVGKYSFAIAINDCFNYVPSEKLQRAFKNVYGALKKGGVFVFDVSSPKKYAEKFQGAVNVDDRDDVTYMSFASLEGRQARLEVTLFVKDSDGRYTRQDETHVQYVHTEEEIAKALAVAGFSVLKTEGHLGEDKAASDRLVFLAQK
ncbi:MAG: class I SAM-dependent methyltransferase [Clostridia bacterium]|nr:class I SAM-dependent methyltransferase [Clostridia bacterium]